MTGNTKVWRAPLAGLAAVAMLATMGLASSTAVAADADPAGAVTLNANGGKFVGSNPGNGDGTLTYWEGADATPNNGRLENLYYGENKVEANGKIFTGWFFENGTAPVSSSTVVTPGTTLYAHWANAKNTDGTNKVVFTSGANVSLGAQSSASSFITDEGENAVVYVKAGDTLAGWESKLVNEPAVDGFFGGWKLNGSVVSDWSTVKGGSVLQPINSGYNDYKLTASTISAVSDTDEIRWYAGDKLVQVGGTEAKLADEGTPWGIKPETVKAYYIDKTNAAQVVTNWGGSGNVYTAYRTNSAYAVRVGQLFKGQTEHDYFATTFPWLWWGYAHQVTKWNRDYDVKYFENVDETRDFLDAFDLSEYEKSDGYNFVGWYNRNPAAPYRGIALEGVNAATVLNGLRVADVLAYFEDDNSNTIAVKFDENYDDAAVTTKHLALKTADGEDQYLGYDLPAPTRDGYTFEGWYNNVDGSARGEDGNYQVTRSWKVSALQEIKGYNGGTRSITLYAKWESSSYATLNQLLKLTNEVTGRHGKTLYNKDSFAKFEKARDAVAKKYNLKVNSNIQYVPDSTSPNYLPQAQADAAAQALLSAKAQLVLTPDARGQFRDVTEATPHFEAIYKLGLAGVINGYADGTFSPATGMTRADFAAYLYRVAGSPSYTVNASDDVFSDVDSSTPHYKEILWASKAGILKGYADGTFGWAALVNRQDAAAFLYRLAGSPDFDEKNAKSNFSDVDSSTPHYKEILWAAANGVVYGYADGTFNGGATILRQDAAALLNRAVVADYLK